MGDQNQDYSSLPLLDRITHKIWKVRLQAYEEIAKIFATADPNSEASLFSTYEPLLKKFVTDSNVAAQENGIAAVIKWVENSPFPINPREDIISGVSEKCMGSPRAGIKNKTSELLLLYCEVDTPAPVVDLLIPGFEMKQPKFAAANVQAVREIIENFGTKNLNLKLLLNQVVKPLGNRDNAVRTEAKKLVVELYKWIRDALNPMLSKLDPVLQRDLETDFSKLPSEKPVALRLLRNEMILEPAAGDMDVDIQDQEDVYQVLPTAQQEDIDPFDIVEPVEVLSKISSDLIKNVSSSKWKERKESLEAILKLVDTTKIADGSYSELVATLASRIPDTNILVATLAANIIEKLALGLRNLFAAYQEAVTKPLLERLKEKKASVVSALHAALNAVFNSSGLQISSFIPDITLAIAHKNPQVRSETIKFFTYCMKTTTTSPSKAQTKDFVALVKPAENDSDPNVRESSYEFLGTLMKAVGEKAFLPFIEGMEKAKESKMKEYFEKATVCIVVAPVKMPTRPPQPPKLKPKPTLSSIANGAKSSSQKLSETSNQIAFKSDSRTPNTGAPATEIPSSPRQPTTSLKAALGVAPGLTTKSEPKLTSRQPVVSKQSSNPKQSSASSFASLPVIVEASLSSKHANAPADDTPTFKFSGSADIDDLLQEIVPTEILTSLQSSLWKDRLNGINLLKENLTSNDSISADLEPELLIRQFSKKPGWKESNFQVNAGVYGLIKWMAEECSKFNSGAAALCIPFLVEKLGDIKLKEPAGSTLVSIAERLGLRFVLILAVESMSKQKSPKVLADSMVWLNQVLLDFGAARLSLRPLIDFVIQTGLSSNNAQVRSKSIVVMGTLRRFVGPSINNLIGSVNNQLMQLLESEFAKVENEPAPTPSRSQPSLNSGSVNKDSSVSISKKSTNNQDDSMEELFPRVDLSAKLGSAIIKKLGDGNWKIRKEALDFINAQLLESNKRIQPTLSNEFVTALKGRLTDSNKNLVTVALSILSLIAESMGSSFEKYLRIVSAPTMQTMSDKKANVRLAATKTLDSYFQGDVVCADILISSAPAALVHDSPELRKDLLAWLGKVLHKIEKESDRNIGEELPSIAGMLNVSFSCLQDRNSDVRKNAALITSFIIKAIGYSEVRSQCTMQLKGAALQSVIGIIETLQPTQRTPIPKAESSSKVLTAAELLRGSQVQRSANSVLQPQSQPQQSQKAQSTARAGPGRPPISKPQDSRPSNPLRPSSSTSSSANAVPVHHFEPRQPEAAQPSNSSLGMQRRPMAVRRRVVMSTTARPESPRSRPASQMSSLSSHNASIPGSPDSPRSSKPSFGSAHNFSGPIVSGDFKQKDLRSRKESSGPTSVKWIFSEAPRPELVSYLYEQMSPFFNAELMGQLFSTSHYRDRDYLIGLSTLDDFIAIPNIYSDKYALSLEQYTQKIVSNSDLIFKYIGARLYDTQTTLVMKSIELAEHLLRFLEEGQQQVSDYEAQLLVPHLINRLGDGKESIRARIRTLLLSSLATLCHPSKIADSAVEIGLRNLKNARVRQESNDLINSILSKYSENFGFGSICPNPAKAVSVIGQSIRDRDASVRTSALNCLVTFSRYLPNGTQGMIRLAGSLPDKERGMLEEKLKRSDVGARSQLNSLASKPSSSPGLFKRSSVLQPPSKLRPASQMPFGQPKTPLSSRSRIQSMSPYQLNAPKTPSNFTAISDIDEYDNNSIQKNDTQSIQDINLPTFSTSVTQNPFDKESLPRFSSKDLYENTLRSEDKSNILLSLPKMEINDTKGFSDSLDDLISALQNEQQETQLNLVDQIKIHLMNYCNNSNTKEHAAINEKSNQVISAIVHNIRLIFEMKNTGSSSQVISSNLMLSGLLKSVEYILSDNIWAQGLDGTRLRALFFELILCMVQLSHEDESFAKVMNSLVSDIIRNCNSSAVVFAMVDSFIHLNITPLKYPLATPQQKLEKKKVELTQRFLWKLEKKLVYDISDYDEKIYTGSFSVDSKGIAELNLNKIFETIHIFFEAIPEKEWVSRQDENVYVFGDEPKKAVKSLLHSLVSSLDCSSWLFVGDIIVRLIQQGSANVSSFGFDVSGQAEHTDGLHEQIGSIVSELAQSSVVIEYIYKYTRSLPKEKQWLSIAEQIKSDLSKIQEERVEMDSIGTAFKENLMVSPKSKPQLLPSLRFEMEGATPSSSVGAIKTNSPSLDRMRAQHGRGDTNPFEDRNSYDGGHQNSPSFEGRSAEQRTSSREKSFGNTANSFTGGMLSSRENGFDISRFPIGNRLKNEELMAKAATQQRSPTEKATSSPGLSERTALSSSPSRMQPTYDTNQDGMGTESEFASRPKSIMTFDENLRALKARLDRMRKERLG